jgi:uncharacterized protein
MKLPKPIETWNRRLHIYLGLYFLIFIWLFSISGLILNHPQWRFTQFWPDRQETQSEHAAAFPSPGENELTRARAVMSQLDLRGEVERIRSAEGQLEFRVVRPGLIVDVRADEATETAHVSQIRTNIWSILYRLHQFNAVSMEDPEQRRNWIGTMLWTLSMDALSLGLIFLVVSGIYMWYRLGNKRIGGAIALAAGVISCAFFIWGLAWLAGP